MGTLKRMDSRAPFGDLTNTSSNSGHDASNGQLINDRNECKGQSDREMLDNVTDQEREKSNMKRRHRDRKRAANMTPQEREERNRKRRERDRERAANMTPQEREEHNRKRREAYQINKEQKEITLNAKGGTTKNKVDPSVGLEWLHTNDAYQRHIQMSPSIQEPAGCTSKSATMMVHDCEVGLMATPSNVVTENKENVDPSLSTEWLHRNDTYQRPNACLQELAVCTSKSAVNAATPSKDRIEARRMKDRERYANMSPNKRAARRECQKVSSKRLRKMRKEAAGQVSIAMENPQFVPELVFPSATNGPKSTQDIVDDMTRKMESIEYSNGSRLYIPQPLQEHPEEESTDSCLGHISPRKHVTPGERHALLSRQNRKFEQSGSKKKNITATDDITSLTQTNMVDTGHCFSNDAIDMENGSPLSPLANDNAHDEGVIFEYDPDDSDDELYLFTGPVMSASDEKWMSSRRGLMPLACNSRQFACLLYFLSIL